MRMLLFETISFIRVCCVAVSGYITVCRVAVPYCTLCAMMQNTNLLTTVLLLVCYACGEGARARRVGFATPLPASMFVSY